MNDQFRFGQLFPNHNETALADPVRIGLDQNSNGTVVAGFASTRPPETGVNALPAVTTATIASHRLEPTGIWVAAGGYYEPGVGRVGFVLIDLTEETTANVVDRKDFEYGASLPTCVAEEWTSVPVIAGIPYRLFFHLYDRTGVNLVAYDRRDFTLPPREEGPR